MNQRGMGCHALSPLSLLQTVWRSSTAAVAQWVGRCWEARALRQSCRSWWRRCSAGRAHWRPAWGLLSAAASTSACPLLPGPSPPGRCPSSAAATGLRPPPGTSTWPAAACLHHLARVNASWAPMACSVTPTLATSHRTACSSLTQRTEALCSPPMGSRYLDLPGSKAERPACRPARAWAAGSTLRAELAVTRGRGNTPLVPSAASGCTAVLCHGFTTQQTPLPSHCRHVTQWVPTEEWGQRGRGAASPPWSSRQMWRSQPACPALPGGPVWPLWALWV